MHIIATTFCPSFPLFEIFQCLALHFVPISFALSTVEPPITQNLIHVAQKCRETEPQEEKKTCSTKTVLQKTIIIIMIRLEWHGEYFELLCVPFGLPSLSSWNIVVLARL